MASANKELVCISIARAVGNERIVVIDDLINYLATHYLSIIWVGDFESF